MEPKIIPIPVSRPSFLASPRCEDLDTLSADLAIIAYPYTVPYSLEWSRQPSSYEPAAIREQSQTYVGIMKHYDFDYAGDIFNGKEVRIVDCGDVYERAGQYEENGRMGAAVIHKILRHLKRSAYPPPIAPARTRQAPCDSVA